MKRQKPAKEKSTVEMTTDRLYLREASSESGEDVGRLLSLFSDEAIVRWSPELPHNNIHGVEEYLQRYTREKEFLNQKAFLFMAFRKDKGDFVGACMIDITENARETSRAKGDAVFHVYTARRFQGKGYMAEVLHELLPMVFYVFEANCAYATCAYKNIRAQRLFLKSGFCALTMNDINRKNNPVKLVLRKYGFRWGGRFIHPSRRQRNRETKPI